MSFLNKLFGGGSGAKSLSAKEFVAKYGEQKGIILDVRTDNEYRSGHLKGAVRADFLGGEFQQKIASLDPSKTYYLYCASGGRSGRASQMLVEKGFENVYNVGGFSELAMSGFPLA